MTIEERLKALILSRYKSIREFVSTTDIPYSTVDAILRRGVMNSNANNVQKLCRALDLSTDALLSGELKSGSGAGSAMKGDRIPAAKLRYLEELSFRFPTIAKASTEIINLYSILNLPKGTEHFLSDIHGEYEQFIHILANASGNVRSKINEEFGFEISKEDKKDLATLIYYPVEKMLLEEESGRDMIEWYRVILLRLIRIARRVSLKYTRSKVRKAIPEDFRYVIEELMSDNDLSNKSAYYDSIIEAIIKTSRAKECISAFSHMIQRLIVDHLHIIGDVFDRGPGPHIVLDTLMEHHSLDIQWGNHDIVWMSAAAGSPLAIATAVRISARYSNLEVLEDGYGINLIPLMKLAVEEYSDSNRSQFGLKADLPEYDIADFEQDVRMHKAITMLQFKLEGQWIKRHPEFGMDDRLLLDKVDYETGTVLVDGKRYKMEDTDFPTVDPADPYRLTEKEAAVMDKLVEAFRQSEKLQRHVRFLLNRGSMYLIYNGNLLYHGSIPLNEDGTFKEFTVDGKSYKGRALLDALDENVRKSYYSDEPAEKAYALDLNYYLWCGPSSPLFGKQKMATFERQFIKDKSVHEEGKTPYYKLWDREDVIDRIFAEFSLDPVHARIVSGHVPVKSKSGESPLKCGGKLLVIDGGFSKAYQDTTGIAGYTLVYNSHGLKLVAHEPFTSKAEAVRTGNDIHSQTTLIERLTDRVTVGDTDIGTRLKSSISDLYDLLAAYRSGLIKEKQ